MLKTLFTTCAVGLLVAGIVSISLAVERTTLRSGDGRYTSLSSQPHVLHVGAPQNFRATYENNGVTLRWDPPAEAGQFISDRLSYLITWGDSSRKLTHSLQSQTTTAIHAPVTRGLHYFYQVQVVGAGSNVILAESSPVIDLAIPNLQPGMVELREGMHLTPLVAVIPPGDTITWLNATAIACMIRIVDTTPETDIDLPQKGSVSFRFNEEGSYGYEIRRAGEPLNTVPSATGVVNVSMNYQVSSPSPPQKP